MNVISGTTLVFSSSRSTEQWKENVSKEERNFPKNVGNKYHCRSNHHLCSSKLANFLTIWVTCYNFEKPSYINILCSINREQSNHNVVNVGQANCKHSSNVCQKAKRRNVKRTIQAGFQFFHQPLKQSGTTLVLWWTPIHPHCKFEWWFIPWVIWSWSGYTERQRRNFFQ